MNIHHVRSVRCFYLIYLYFLYQSLLQWSHCFSNKKEFSIILMLVFDIQLWSS
jgi:hypothetical protein